jgi:hypothetical protein
MFSLSCIAPGADSQNDEPAAVQLMYGDAGSIMRVRSGTIVRYVVNPDTETVNGLVASG